MLDKLLGQLFKTRMMRLFKINTTPRWVILLIDMFIVTASFVVTVLSDSYSHKTPVDPVHMLGGWAVIIAVYFLVTFFSKSYTCVIRLSVIEDLYRSIVVVVTSTFILLAINFVMGYFTGYVVYGYWNILIIGALSLAAMMIERLFIKWLYMRLTLNESRRRALVLGTSLDSLILANALKNEIGGRFEPVGLLSIKTGKENETINGFRVYRFDPETTAETFAENEIDALIFNASTSDLMRHGFADYFMRANISLLAINKMEEYELDDDKPHGAGNISTHIKEVQIEDLLGREPISLNNTLVVSHIENSCVLITGACGSIGSE
ncbi:MAG: hypothetical protein II022_07470, partial [Muribaculaceae bacterium]|nr:hypothetical protein [Muribaculaceae bacterium]